MIERREWAWKRGVILTDSCKLQQRWPLVFYIRFPLFLHIPSSSSTQSKVLLCFTSLLYQCFLTSHLLLQLAFFFLFFYYIHSKLDPKDLISLNVYLHVLCCFICWRVVHLSQSTKHCLSVCFRPLFYHFGKIGWVFMFLESIKDIYSHISNLKAMTNYTLGQFVVSPETF